MTRWWWWLFSRLGEFWENVRLFIPRLRFFFSFFFEVEISSRTLATLYARISPQWLSDKVKVQLLPGQDLCFQGKTCASTATKGFYLPPSGIVVGQTDFDLTIRQCVVFDRNLARAILTRHETLSDVEDILSDDVVNVYLLPKQQ